MNMPRLFCLLSAIICLATWTAGVTLAQKPPSGLDRDRARIILSTIKEDLRKNYYDPTFHGMDLEQRFRTAEEKMKQAESLGQLFGIIAQVLIDLDDSHTFFIPPGR